MDLADLMVWSKKRWPEMSYGVSGKGLASPRAGSCCMGSALLIHSCLVSHSDGPEKDTGHKAVGIVGKG